jgi:hypothetical protein
MAKGQLRGNKETKKPKQDKSLAKAPAAGGMVAPMTQVLAKNKAKAGQ